MCLESGGDCFDSTLVEAEDNGFSQNPSFSIEEEDEEEDPYHHNSSEQAAMDMELIQQHLNLEQCYNTNNTNNDGNKNWRFIQELGDHEAVSDWGFSQYHQSDLHISSLPPTTPDLLGMFSLLPSSSSLLPNPPISFSNNTYPEPSSSFLSSSLGLSGDLPTGDASSTLVCDPSMFPFSSLPWPPQPPLLFHSLPHGFGGSSSSSLFDERDEEVLKNNNVANFYQEDVNGGGRGFDNGVFEFTADINNGLAKTRDGKDSKHFATEKQRRVHFNDKFQALRKLIPNPTKNDRASILGDAIEYINELKSTATKLKVLVEKKKSSRERIKRQKTTVDGTVNDVVKSEEDMLQPYNNGVSSSTTSTSSSCWHRRKSKNTEVDVRIVDDEVTVKLVQHKGTNCLLLVSKVLDDLHLDLYHVAGGLIGDYYSFLFNSKIFRGTTVYASAIANMLVEATEKQYTTLTQQPLHLQAVPNEKLW